MWQLIAEGERLTSTPLALDLSHKEGKEQYKYSESNPLSLRKGLEEANNGK